MRVLIAIAIFRLSLAGIVHGENWPQWRGPYGTGVSKEKAVPDRWSSTENIEWKVLLGGLGVSSPIVWEDRIFVTSQLGKGVLRSGSHPTLARNEGVADERPLGGGVVGSDDGKVTFLVEAFHRADGRRLWEYKLEAEGHFPEVHRKHNMASPSAVTDGKLVYAWFGTGQLIALDLDGKLEWKRHLGLEFSPFDINWGHGSSPTLYDDLLILQCYHRPASYLLAVDKRTGQEKWRVDREKGVTSFSTPLVVRKPDGDALIVNSTDRVTGYNPVTGELLWYAGEPQRYALPAPAYENGVLYMSRGYRSGPYMALEVGGRGDVSKTHIMWRIPTGAPYVSSLVYHDGLVYMANGNGIMTCTDGATGKKVWQERIGGIFTASPVVADGKIYFLSETGETVVLRPGGEPHILARNQLEERTVASPAISNGQIFIRSDKHLICIGAREKPTGLQ